MSKSNKSARKDLEIWKDIKGYEGFYQVSNTGKVKSLDRIVKDNNRERYQKLKGKMLSQTDNGRGYKLVFLRKDDKRTNKYVHRLVAEAFIPNLENLPEVNHKNLNKADNSVDNLEWISNLENKRHYQSTDIAKINNKKTALKIAKKYRDRINPLIPKIIYQYTELKYTIKKIKENNDIGANKIAEILKENNIKTRKKGLKVKKIGMFDKNNNLIAVYDNYKEIYKFIKFNKLSKATYDTISSEIYDAVTMRRNSNCKYGYIWKKVD